MPTLAMLFTPLSSVAFFVSLDLVARFAKHLESFGFTEHSFYKTGEIVKGA
jgi:hypothetical protein